MRKSPFHLRILPWIFTITFFGVAPALVFYTAGYRWNPKKDMIERNGTVIIDSVPSGANIQVDGRTISNTTPVTIQSMPPGEHHFTISKNGYFPWEKSLEVIAEHVTFANDIQLWKQKQPQFIINLAPGILSLSTDKQHLLYLSSSTPTKAVLINTHSLLRSTLTVPNIEGKNIFWSPNGRYALVESKKPLKHSWLIDTNTSHQTLKLPPSIYRWQNSDLIGNDKASLLTIQTSNFSLTQSTLQSGQIDILKNNLLMLPNGTTRRAYVDIKTPNKGFTLPPGAWTFWTSNQHIIILRNGMQWLSLVKDNAGFEYHTASGDMLRQDPSSRKPNKLLVNGNEIWTWNPTTEPQLLLRQSEPIIDAAWYTNGKNIFYATATKLRALNLDQRDGRLETLLASFDNLTDFAFSGKQLFILGSKNGRTGLWTLHIE